MGQGNTPCAVAQAPAELDDTMAEVVAAAPACEEHLAVQTSTQLTALLKTEPVKEGPSDELLPPSPQQLGTGIHASPVCTPRTANSLVLTPATNVDCTPIPSTVCMGFSPIPATLCLASPSPTPPTKVLAAPTVGLTVPQTSALPQATSQKPSAAVSRIRFGRCMEPRKLFAVEADSQQQARFTAAATSEAGSTLPLTHTGNDIGRGMPPSSPKSPRPVAASSEVGPVSSSSSSVKGGASKSSLKSQTVGVLDAAAMSPKPSKTSPVLGILTGPSLGQAAAAQPRQPAGAVSHCCCLMCCTSCKDAGFYGA